MPRLYGIARDSTQRAAFVEVAGKRLFPYLRDPNTGAALFDSATTGAYPETTLAA
ncbi:MAG: hypothetical protein FJ102_24760 [Deltaproteobacteria bacterium]|nr:hypothetical protein [Deltaproteobacteria bacterium]